jgi:hypothetical protein
VHSCPIGSHLFEADVNVVNARGETLLFDLLLPVYPPRTARSMIRTVTLLLEYGIDPTVKDKYGTTIVQAIKRPTPVALHLPVEFQESPVWQLIRDSGRTPKRPLSSPSL